MKGKIDNDFICFKHKTKFWINSPDVVESIIFYPPLPLIILIPDSIIFPFLFILVLLIPPLFKISNPPSLPSYVSFEA